MNDNTALQIKSLMEAKDELERGFAILEREDSIAVNHAAKRIRCGISLLRIEITNLQIGITPQQQAILDMMPETPVVMPMAKGVGKAA